MKKGITELQRKVAEEYVKCNNIQLAGERAGVKGKNVKVTAWQMMQRPAVQEYVSQLQAIMTSNTIISAERTLREIARLSFADITQYHNPDGSYKKLTELSSDQTAAIQSIKFKTLKTGERVITKIILFKKEACIEKLMKYQGLYKVDNAQQANIIITTKEHRRSVKDFSKVNVQAEQPGEEV